MLLWFEVLEFLRNTGSVLLIAGGFAGIIFILYISIGKIMKKNPVVAILFSTICNCILVVPIITSINHFADIKAGNIFIDEAKAEVQVQKTQAELLKRENRVRLLEKERLETQAELAKKDIEIVNLSRSKTLLENARLSMQSFQTIAELALTQANFKHTLVRKEPVTPLETGWGIRADYFYDEVLVIINHDINAKYGIDLNEVKIVKLSDDSVVVSGIRPKYIGSDKIYRDDVVKEIRRIDNKFGVQYRVTRQNDRQYLLQADEKAQNFELEFQKRLSEGMELAFMDDAIIQLAQNFIKIVLAPIYNNIEFRDEQSSGALPLMEYLTKELRDNDEEKFNNLKISEELIIKVNVLENDLSDAETEGDQAP
jgi:hypothetical protein